MENVWECRQEEVPQGRMDNGENGVIMNDAQELVEEEYRRVLEIVIVQGKREEYSQYLIHLPYSSPQNGGKYCVGMRERYRSCATDECPWDTPPFRDVQCAEYNSKVRKDYGRKIKEVPFRTLTSMD